MGNTSFESYKTTKKIAFFASIFFFYRLTSLNDFGQATDQECPRHFQPPDGPRST